MKQFGFFRVASAIPGVKVAECSYNAQQIEKLIKQADAAGAEVIVFPELSITGYSCMDLFATQTIKEQSSKQLQYLLNATSESNIISIVGIPVYAWNRIFNCAAVICRGNILGLAVKSNIPNHNDLQELRWFSPASELQGSTVNICGQEVFIGNNLIFNITGEQGVKFAVEICEDLWAPVPVSSIHATNGAQVIFNLSASSEAIEKHKYLLSLLKSHSAKTVSGYVYSSAGFGESTTDLVFAGDAIIAENGKIISQSERFSIEEQLVIADLDINYLEHDRTLRNTFTSSENTFFSDGIIEIECEGDLSGKNYEGILRKIERHPFVPQGKELDERCEEIFNIQTAGLAKRLVHTNCRNAVVGISGGLDSTLAILVTVKTFDMLGYDRKGIIAITMPGFGTTGRTYNNAISLMESLGVTIREISIKDACIQHFKDIGHDLENHNVVYENSQARERTQILMDVANQLNAMVIGTGDLSELALGWATYNGDHMCMYGVNGCIPKTLVKSLVEWVANNSSNEITRNTLLDIADTPISPELIPADDKGNIKQKTEDLVGPYELHDFFIYHFMRHGASPAKIFALAKVAFDGIYDNGTIKKWLSTFFRRFFNQQFKRSCLPDGPKVGSVALSPRGDWRMPSDAASALWLKEVEELG